MHLEWRLQTPRPESEQQMKQEHMTEILTLVKRIGNLFVEVEELSKQLSDAIDRRDEVSMGMIIAMRSEPIEKLAITDRSLRELLFSLDDGEEVARLRAILNGEMHRAIGEQEKLLAEQAAMNIRTHRRMMELDERLNRKVAHERSIYNKKD